MIYGIYVRTKPKNKWCLHSLKTSIDEANKDGIEAIEKAKEKGLDKAEFIVKQYFEMNHIPEFIDNLKNEKILIN